nr:MAG TPA_asm: hypothetical protein [Caudoviricetes sp.]
MLLPSTPQWCDAGLAARIHWRIAACRSMERHFCWLSAMGS